MLNQGLTSKFATYPKAKKFLFTCLTGAILATMVSGAFAANATFSGRKTASSKKTMTAKFSAPQKKATLTARATLLQNTIVVVTRNQDDQNKLVSLPVEIRAQKTDNAATLKTATVTTPAEGAQAQNFIYGSNDNFDFRLTLKLRSGMTMKGATCYRNGWNPVEESAHGKQDLKMTHIVSQNPGNTGLYFICVFIVSEPVTSSTTLPSPTTTSSNSANKVIPNVVPQQKTYTVTNTTPQYKPEVTPNTHPQYRPVPTTPPSQPSWSKYKWVKK